MTGRLLDFRLSSALTIGASLLLATAASAEKLEPVRSIQQSGTHSIEMVDLTPRFLAFYRSAADETDPAARFALWKEHYGFGAFPPGPAGEKIARQLLDEAWPHYPARLATLERGAATFGDEPIRTLQAVAALLEADQPLSVRFNAYVGGFEDNAFVAADGSGTPIVNFPIEMSADKRRLIMPHEFTHAVHQRLARLSGGWERTIGTTLIQEGLAMHVARRLVPGKPVSAYVEHEVGWWPQAEARKTDILRGILPALDASDSDSVLRFTMGQGPAGLQREAYATGWWVIEALQGEGMTLAEIARVPEEQLPELARRAIRSMLES